ncbi:MAG: MBOAT family protein [Bacteroidales bacterium]|nr:MBOAT family protein [Bacteroidales bacterium]
MGGTFLVYYLTGKKYRWVILFLSSLVFLGSLSYNLVMITLLFAIVNYLLGIGLETIQNQRYRKTIFRTGIFLNIGFLAFYKYINFLIGNVNAVLGLLPQNTEIPYINVIIPIGISYYTFQAMGYLIRINRKAEKAERNFGLFTTYLIFFPKFLAGPVERSNLFLPQIRNNITFDSQQVSAGIRLFLWGLFKKVVIANNLVAPVSAVYGQVEEYTGTPLILVFFIQTIHLYCDFSGYTDMALGSAKVFGIKLIDNFNRPFFAKNVGEFWRRWHISLSSWCNDFIFTPFIIRYRKMGQRAAIIGIFLTFTVIGIWHGANWTYVVLGLLQGIAISYEFYTKRKRIRLAQKLPAKFVVFTSRVLTFLFFCFTLIFFNAGSLTDAWYFISHMFSGLRLGISGYHLVVEKGTFVFALLAYLFVLIYEYQQERGVNLLERFISQPFYVKWTAYYILIILAFIYNKPEDSFVYLQF